MTRCEVLKTMNRWPYVMRCKDVVVARLRMKDRSDEELDVCSFHLKEGLTAGALTIQRDWAELAVEHAINKRQTKLEAVRFYRMNHPDQPDLKTSVQAINAECAKRGIRAWPATF